jgi:arsenite methyltransferase
MITLRVLAVKRLLSTSDALRSSVTLQIGSPCTAEFLGPIDPHDQSCSPMKDTHDPAADVWSDWLLHARHGDNPAVAETMRADIEQYADRVLDAAQLAPGMRLADIGAGEGLIAFRAIERIGPTLSVLLTDISAPMLRHAREMARQRRIDGQCSFLLCPADRLDGIDGASVDAVASRAALAYVADKSAALREFRRVLKPGGRISFAEPILQDEAFLAAALRTAVNTPGARSQDRFQQLLHRWKSAQYPDTLETIAANPLVSFSERNLFEIVRSAGFADIHLELHIDLRRSMTRSWEVFLQSSPHPLAPSTEVILAEKFTPEERAFFEKRMRPLVESPDAVAVTRVVYLNATKPLE